MKLKFWGTRGSIPTPGKETVRYGGNTPCVELRLPNGELVIFDAGTGIRGLGDALAKEGNSIKAHLLISHPHWDHLQGFPFFKPAFISGNEITIIGAQSKEVTLRRMIANLMDKAHLPIQLDELTARIDFHPIKEGSTKIHDGVLRSCFVNHPYSTLGYRIDVAGQSVVYISDNEPFDREIAASVKNVDKATLEKYRKTKGDPNQRIFDFAYGADVLIHDSTYTPEEYVKHVGWGHSDYLFSLRVANESHVQRLVLFHHEQTHSDEQIDQILEICRREIKLKKYTFECVAAAEGMVVEW
jgi:phosphoribosyl 1,2-cyclic phosphodiesterase